MTLSHLIGLTSWEQGCGQAFLGDSLRSPRPSDLLACQLASRREDHGQVSIITTVCFGQEPCRSLTLILACIVCWQASEISRLAAAPDFPFDPAKLKMRGS